MGKRSNESSQMKREDYEAMENAGSSNNETGAFSRVSAEVLQQRRIVRGRRLHDEGGTSSTTTTTTTVPQPFSTMGKSSSSAAADRSPVNPFATVNLTASLQKPTGGFKFGGGTTTTTTTTALASSSSPSFSFPASSSSPTKKADVTKESATAPALFSFGAANASSSSTQGTTPAASATTTTTATTAKSKHSSAIRQSTELNKTFQTYVRECSKSSSNGGEESTKSVVHNAFKYLQYSSAIEYQAVRSSENGVVSSTAKPTTTTASSSNNNNNQGTKPALPSFGGGFPLTFGGTPVASSASTSAETKKEDGASTTTSSSSSTTTKPFSFGGFGTTTTTSSPLPSSQSFPTEGFSFANAFNAAAAPAAASSLINNKNDDDNDDNGPDEPEPGEEDNQVVERMKDPDWDDLVSFQPVLMKHRKSLEKDNAEYNNFCSFGKGELRLQKQARGSKYRAIMHDSTGIKLLLNIDISGVNFVYSDWPRKDRKPAGRITFLGVADSVRGPEIIQFIASESVAKALHQKLTELSGTS